MATLQINSLSKSYGDKIALNQVNLCLTPGVYGLLGPNGAGKSTLMNIIAGNLTPDAGEILYNGENVSALGKSFRSILGFMPQQQGLYEHFTGYQFLSYIAALKGMDRKQAKAEIETVIGLVNLREHSGKKLGAYSGGMKQRILIAQALLDNPKILILDEPTAGLDPKERIRIRNIISEIALDKIVIFATHVVSDVEQIAKEIIMIKKGNILGEGSVQYFFSDLDGKVFELNIEPERLGEVEGAFLVSNVSFHADQMTVRVISDSSPYPYSFSQVRPTLEDVYLYQFADEMGNE
ncbi:MAG: ABC transporter ATP-binding protein [Lachnospiraceae bacterium]|nr:ABC transporter ATP-binding protein [Lachnospiraceae bacterium]